MDLCARNKIWKKQTKTMHQMIMRSPLIYMLINERDHLTKLNLKFKANFQYILLTEVSEEGIK